MRLVSFLREGRWCPALRRGDSIVEIADSDLGSAQAVIAAVAAGRRLTEGRSHPLADITLGLPVPEPGKIVCIGLNYVDHAKEGGNPIPDYPAVFLRTKSSLVAHGQPLVRPLCSDKFDYEAELAIVIGKPARNVSEADALSHVFGYACFNDGSLRDYQRKSTQWTMGKNFDGTGPFGPDIVTADELPAGAAGLRIVCRLNGQTLQDGNTGNMIFPVARTIALISEVMTLEPGDVIITGTPAGVGYPRKPPIFLRPGDVCEIEIEGIGILRNPVVSA
ncbi:MAG: FAA hydrolase family protein [Bradyrhizobium sp.]|jgi:acylpyruvate hydrolase|uniref:fumarylacetoacetate hydrolase family protein n=1 Tax=Bradyrhizobium sp. TaxID=376 RepID=UPI001211C80C|nr:fumarylacetoacetate hydrolase family protein [Bradyrhizobium sp.]THD51611.1 MAG: FAA hydrolase family protein [Bradyrhizobium sp.]